MPEPFSAEQFADKLEGRGIIQPADKPFRSGFIAQYKVEGDVVTTDPELCAEAVPPMVDLVRLLAPDLLLPIPQGGDALALGIADKLEKTSVAFYCKVGNRELGTESFRVRSPFINKPLLKNALRVVLIDDVYTSGSSFDDMATVLGDEFGFERIGSFSDPHTGEVDEAAIPEEVKLIVGAVALWDRQAPVEQRDLQFPHYSVIQREVL